jgi:hypothetical protein
MANPLDSDPTPRLVGEGDRAYWFFLRYRDLGPQRRSIAAVRDSIERRSPARDRGRRSQSRSIPGDDEISFFPSGPGPRSGPMHARP